MPYNTTAKALLINSATQWSFSGVNHDRTRVHQGWGHPDRERLSNRLARQFIVDEEDVLTNLEARNYVLEVHPGEASLRATLVFRDPAGTTSSTLHRINDLDLRDALPPAKQPRPAIRFAEREMNEAALYYELVSPGLSIRLAWRGRGAWMS